MSTDSALSTASDPTAASEPATPAPSSSTPSFKRANGLTIEQQNAVDLLVSGSTDAAVAERVGVYRTTVTRWRLHDPYFRAALNQRREEVWREAGDSARALLPTALTALQEQLADGDLRGRLALDVLRAAGVFGRPSPDSLATALIGPTTPDAFIQQDGAAPNPSPSATGEIA